MTAELATIDMFSDKVGQAFVVEEPDLPAIELTLVEVTPMRNYANAARAPFSLLFTSRGSAVLLAADVSRCVMRPWDCKWMFLVPIAGNKESVTYQAIFN